MALTAPHTDYTTALSSGAKEDYLVKLNWYDSDDASTGTVGISMRSSATINSISYTPAILKAPTIREGIDLKAYTSSFGNVTIECTDFSTAVSTFPLTNSATLFSAEFHSNNLNRYYMNRTLEIYSMLNDSEDESKCLKIFSGRLTKVDVNPVAKTVRLQASSYNPFDHIEIPVTRDSETNTPAPIVYGAYTPNTFGGYATSKTLWRCPILDKAKQQFVRALLRDSSIASDAHPHTYDEVLDQFVPVAINSGGSVDSASETYNGVAISYADFRLYRSAKQKPIGYSSDSGSGWTNTDNAFNNSSADDTSNFATSQQATFAVSASGTGNSTDNNDVGVFDLPQYSGRPTAYTIVVAYKLHATISDATSWSGDALVRLNARVDDNDFSDSDSNSLWNKTTNQLEVSEAGSGDSTGVSGSIITQTYTVTVATVDGFPKQLALRTEAVLEEHNQTGTFLHYATIYDIRISCVQSIDFSQANNNLQSGMRELLGMDFLYCGADGYTQSWGGALTTIVDMHRDLIYRFGGITATPTDWQTVDTARANRAVRFWLNDFMSLQNLMNQCQFEGNFIFRVDSTGAYKYIDPHATRTVTTLGRKGSELVTNGTFQSESELSGWSNLRCDLSISSQRLRVSSNATSGNGYAYRNFTAVIGKKYTVTADFFAGNTSGCKIAVGQTDALSTGTFQGTSGTLTSNTSVTFDFTATATTQVVWLYQVANNANTTYDDWDNVSILEKNYAIFTSTDINNWKFDLTPISDVVSKYNLLYNKHPGTEEWQDNDASTNTNPRTYYNLGNQTNENVKDQEFHILNDSTGTGEWATNRFAFFGGVGMYCTFDVFNPSKYYMEVGDFFKFDSTIGYAFGLSVVDQVWICTQMTRTVGKLKIKGFYLGAEA